MSRQHRRISRAAAQASKLMPEDGDLAGLVANLAKSRGRPVSIVPYSFPETTTTSGLLVDVGTEYMIFVDNPSSPSRRAGIICHEVAHLLLEHRSEIARVPLIDLGTSASEPAEHLFVLALARSSYDDLQESEAELTATLIGAEHSRRQLRAELDLGRRDETNPWLL